jgi:predicted Zn finger-like uncharacterized protein
MRIECPDCHKAYNLPEEKLPKTASLFKCQGCGGKIPVAPPAAAAPEAPAAPPTPADAPTGNGSSTSLIPEDAMANLRRQVTQELLRTLGLKVPDGSSEAEAEDDKPVGLVCEDEELFQGVIGDALQKMGYRVELASTVKAAIDRLQVGTYATVTVDNRFPDDPEGGYKLLQIINNLPPERRRKMFVAFISADLATMDLNSAFILGANLTVGKKDIKRLDKILHDGLREHNRRYRVFFQVEEEVQGERA